MKRGLFFILTLGLILSAGISLAQEKVGEIAAVEGRAYIKPTKSARWQKATKGTPVFSESILRTSRHSRMAVVFKDGSRLVLGDMTIVSVEKFLLKKQKRRINIFIFKGKIRSIVAPFKGLSNIQVRSQGAIAGVRGTEFVLYHKPPVNIIYTVRGKVQVASPAAPTVHITKADQITENTQGRGFIAPDKVPEKIKEAIELLLKSTATRAPINWAESGKLPQILARWNINYGKYLIDKKRFSDALEVFQIAHDLTQNPELRAESLVCKANVYARFIKDYPKAAYEYRKVLTYYPETGYAETALYQLGMLYVETNRKQAARKILERYLILYPEGRYVKSVESLLKRIR